MTYHRVPFNVEATQPAWMKHASCKTEATAVFFVDDRPQIIKKAKRVCSTCPVADDCLEYSLSFPKPWYGTFGGYTAHERKAIARKRRNK
jgi:WhiB family redox-sensing transcriptional regulator